MTLSNIIEIIKGKKPLIDVWHYLLGNYRYKLFYSKKFGKLIRKHIFEQIKYRIEWMDRECYFNGSCRMCGCMTTHLQMSNKSCSKPCYPPMMNKGQWEYFKVGGELKLSDGWYWMKQPSGKLIRIDNLNWKYEFLNNH